MQGEAQVGAKNGMGKESAVIVGLWKEEMLENENESEWKWHFVERKEKIKMPTVRLKVIQNGKDGKKSKNRRMILYRRNTESEQVILYK